MTNPEDGRLARVDYHARLGVEEFHMHVPVGPHIEALFDGEARERRIRETTALNERSPESVGTERLQMFDHPAVTWQKYYGAPTANYYSGVVLTDFPAALRSFKVSASCPAIVSHQSSLHNCILR